LQNKEKFRGSRTLVMLSGGNVDQKTFAECLSRAS
jgi:threonine dehydratase